MNTFEQVSSVCHQISLARRKGPCTVGSHVRVITEYPPPQPENITLNTSTFGNT